jgi:hypothetical protein
MTNDQIKHIYLESTGFDLDDSDAALMDFARALLAHPDHSGDGGEKAQQVAGELYTISNDMRYQNNRRAMFEAILAREYGDPVAEIFDRQDAGFERCYEALGIADDRERSWSSLVMAISDALAVTQDGDEREELALELTVAFAPKHEYRDPDTGENCFSALGFARDLIAALASSKAAAVAVGEPTQEIWEYSFIHNSALGRPDEKVGPCLTYNKDQAFGAGCIEQRLISISAPITSAEEAITQAAALAFIDQFEIVGDNNDSRDPTGEERFILREFILQLFDDTAAPAPITSASDAVRDQEERETDEYVIKRLSEILAGVAVALKGPELPLHRHGCQDLVDIANALKLEVELYRANATHPAAAQPSRALTDEHLDNLGAILFARFYVGVEFDNWAEADRKTKLVFTNAALAILAAAQPSRAEVLEEAALSDDELALIREEAATITDDWSERQLIEPTRKESDAKFVHEILRLAGDAK